MVVDVAELDHTVIVQFSGVLTCVKTALHIVNIDFELN